MAPRADAVVVGAGVMGAAAAWQLARRGHDVVVLERFEPGHARGSSHGSSRIVRLAYTDPFYVDLAAASYAGWHELESETGTTVVTFTGAVDHGDPATVAALADTLQSRGHAANLMDADEAHERWPGLRFEGTVVHHPRAGRVHADDAVAAFRAAAEAHGARFRFGTRVRSIRTGSGGGEVITDDETHRARVVVAAPGAWASSLLHDVLPLPRLTVTMEQPAHFAPHDPATPWPSFIHHRNGAGRREANAHPAAEPHGTYGLAGDDGVKVGFHAVGRRIDPDDGPRDPDAAALDAVRAYVRRWVPGVDDTTADPVTCLYTLTDSTDFVVDRAGPVVVAGGFSGHGFKFAPELGRLVADLVDERRSPPERFRLPVIARS